MYMHQKILLVLLSYTFYNLADNIDLPLKDSSRTQKLPPCQSCKAVVESFRKGMERTARGQYEGGDADWEETRLKSYLQSEVRLVEIQEGLCRDLSHNADQCHSFVDENDNLIEKWWFNYQKNIDLHQFLCIDNVKVCCPDKHYGADCKPCLGYPDVCSNNGKCKGNGTRKGDGQCKCDKGYTGDLCNSCADGYFQLYKDDTKIICDQCHVSCKSTCTESGPSGCIECADGWYKNTKGCSDINECLQDANICANNQFCVNKEGSYQCLECDPSCNGCTGDGPDMCVKCAKGYKLENKLCIDTSSRDRNRYIDMTRYLTYAGLAIATCIIFQRNVIVASIIGLAVALYISVSEYMLGSIDHFQPIFDTTKLQNQLQNLLQ